MEQTCIASAECDKKPCNKRGWCWAHYQRWRRHGDPLAGRREPGKTTHCEVDSCDRPHFGLGLCGTHYARFVKRGEAGGADLERVGFPLNLYKFADTSGGPDVCWPWTACLSTGGYGMINNPPKGRSRHVHILLYEEVIGPVPDDCELDHLCHRGEDCTSEVCEHRRCVNPSHLEPVPHQINMLRGKNSLDWNGLCKKGLHDVTNPANVIVDKQGLRRCRECRNASARATRSRARERRRSA